MRRVARSLKQSRKSLFAFGISGVNQLCSSATNLLLGLYLVRNMTPDGFGMFNIAFALIISVGALSNSIFLVPMTVAMPHADVMTRKNFILKYIVAAFLIVGSVAAIAQVVIFGLYIFNFNSGLHITYLSAVCLACVLYLARESVVQGSYNDRRESVAMWVNIGSGTSVAGMLAVIHLSKDINISPPGAVMIYGASQAVGAIVGFRLLFRQSVLPGFSMAGRQAILLLKGGLWPASSSLLSLARVHGHTVVVAALLGPSGVAVMNATRLFFAPIQMVPQALVRVAMPRLVNQLRVDRPLFQRSTLALTTVLGIVTLFYCVLTLIISPEIYNIVVGNQYAYSAMLFVAWGMNFLFVALRSGIELNQQAQGRFRRLAFIAAISAFMTIAAAILLVPTMGPAGAVLGLACGEAITFGLLLNAVLRAQQTRPI